MSFLQEDQDEMSNVLKVEWTIIPQIPPQPWLDCNGCSSPRPFECSGKARLNANGKKLDAWLIYGCPACSKTWNRPIFERRNIGDIDAKTLQALQGNDPTWISAQAFDLVALRKKTQHIDEFDDVEVRKVVLGVTPVWSSVEINMVVPMLASIRVDKLIASEFGLSRNRVRSLWAASALRSNTDRGNVLRRRVRHGSRLVLDVADPSDQPSIEMAACGR
ncbi:hypothetical protein EV132_13931 [Rhizobium sullae]|uniref:DUF1062 domain-containing protein n=2 Tax=Rhizobium sullae TaxID=50338 RepID=A0A4R3PQQ9_RHISU|nr:hypothetical protein EV132_13931 [Rhizobium sullae]